MLKITPLQWVNTGIFALFSLAGAGWWTNLLTPDHAAIVANGLGWAGSVLNFVLTGNTKTTTTPTTPAA